MNTMLMENIEFLIYEMCQQYTSNYVTALIFFVTSLTVSEKN